MVKKKEEINTFVQEIRIKLINNERKYIYNVTKDFCFNFLIIKESWKKRYHGFHGYMKLLTLIIIRNVSWWQIT